MFVIPFYDEFSIYNEGIEKEINHYVYKLIKKGIKNDKQIIKECIEKFGSKNLDVIEKVIYFD